MVFIGDVADWHRVSRHVKAAGTRGAEGEYEEALGVLAEWHKEFPRADVTEGNHDKRIIRAAWDAEVPEVVLRDYNEVWQTPTWRWHCGAVPSVVIDDVLYTHGTSAPAGRPALSLAKLIGQSVVCGHFHKEGGVSWTCRPEARRFGMDTGCGIDDTHPAMRYGMDYVAKSVLSCGVVVDGLPYHEIMRAGPGEPYNRKRFRAKR